MSFVAEVFFTRNFETDVQVVYSYYTSVPLAGIETNRRQNIFSAMKIRLQFFFSRIYYPIYYRGQ